MATRLATLKERKVLAAMASMARKASLSQRTKTPRRKLAWYEPAG